jgi:predicted short-subunit dehydrogenase-like oxidoreductase (DUF2520 family)
MAKKRDKKAKIGIIGVGKTGTALASRLYQKAYPIVSVSSSDLADARNLATMIDGCQACETSQEVADLAELVFITTPDDIITTVCNEVKWHKGQNVVHCSGVHSVDILESARKMESNIGCFHPLQTFADTEQAIANLTGSTFGIEAEDPLLTMLKDMATALAGNWVILKPGDKVMYHAAAVFVCNYLITLMKQATDLWYSFGIPPSQASKALIPLVEGTLRNIETVGLPTCLTGPIARGDLGTIQKHIEALNSDAPKLLSTYKELGKQTIPIALAKGTISSKRAVEMQVLLS